METTTLKATPRTQLGTRSARREREAARIPAIIYGHKQEPEPISLTTHDVEVALAHGVRVLGLELNGKTAQYLIKQVQYDFRADTPIHLDLMRVDLDERVTVKVGIELRGTPKGVAEGGVLEQLLMEIEVECLVTQIPETLHPPVIHLGTGEALCLEDIELPEGVVATHDPEEKVALVRAPVAEVEEEGVVEETEEAQPEVIGRGKEEKAEDAKG